MISRFVGTLLKKSTADRKTLVKLMIALIVSNIFFFLLFSGSEAEVLPQPAAGQVEVHLRAELLTPFQFGKKVLIIQRSKGQRVTGVLKAQADAEGRFTVEVAEAEAEMLFQEGGWEILPYLKTLSFNPIPKGASHEIRY